MVKKPSPDDLGFYGGHQGPRSGEVTNETNRIAGDLFHQSILSRSSTLWYSESILGELYC